MVCQHSKVSDSNISSSNGPLASHFSYVYCNKDRSNEWALREQSQKAVREMEPYLRGHLSKLTRGSVCGQFLDTLIEP